jgi:hypothetical protein
VASSDKEDQVKPRATVREIDGELVLDDPDALAVARAVAKHNCKATVDHQAERVAHFRQRVVDRNLEPSTVVIVLINVDDPVGGLLAESLMPGHDWGEYRDRGEVPYARGLAARDGIEKMVKTLDEDAGEKLAAIAGLAIVVFDFGTVEVFS